MKRLSLTCAAILTSVAALAGVGPAGWASADELLEPGSRGEASPLQKCKGFYCLDDWNATVGFRVAGGLALGNPTTVSNLGTIFLHPLRNAGDRGAGYETRFLKYLGHVPGDVGVSWPILREGAQTGYTVTARTHFDSSDGSSAGFVSDCSVAGPTGEGPFHCYLTPRDGYWNWDLHLTTDDVDRKRVAEASGSLTTTGSVSLAQGEFLHNSATHLDGAAALPADASTQFDDVLTTADGEGKDKARMKFQYALLDNGQPVISKDNGQPLYVFGGVSNRRMWDRFVGDSSCHFITLDDHIETNPDYTCTRRGTSPLDAGGSDDRAHYITDFTITKK